MAPDPLAEIRTTFFQECDEQLAELENGLLVMQDGAGDADTINAIFRAVHSIKGGAGIFALETLVHFAHIFENILDDLRSDRLTADAGVMRCLLQASDMLSDLVKAAREGSQPDEQRSQAIAAELNALAGGTEDDLPTADDVDTFDLDDFGITPVRYQFDEAAPQSNIFAIRFHPHPSLYASANEVALLFRELGRLGRLAVRLDTSGLPALDSMHPEHSYLTWNLELETDQGEATIRELFEFVEGFCDLAIASAQSPASSQEAAATVIPDNTPIPSDSAATAAACDSDQAPKSPAANVTGASRTVPVIRVDLDKVDRLIDLVGELVINQAMLAQRVAESGMVKASNVSIGLDELEHLTRDIQDSVMAIRAQPVRSVFQRMPRFIREMAEQLDKRIRFVTDGENTEVDKTVIEKLSDPLTHMIRNAVDHGLESPAERLDAGKPEEGTIRLSAFHRSGRIVIEVADDGRGIDRVRVRAKAIESGIISPTAELSDEEIDNLIFAPGFSTAETISDISGRGVGMDVVRRSIQTLGGRITIVSRPGKGSVFTMSLPLTLAVLDGMVISVAGQTLVAPLSAILETLQPRPNQVRTVVGGGQMLMVRESYVPLLDVGSALGFRKKPLPPHEGIVLLVVGEDGVRRALLVDDLIGQRQIVIKSLETNFRQVRGVAAATILGDGRVALILDIDTISSRAMASERIEQHLSAVG